MDLKNRRRKTQGVFYDYGYVQFFTGASVFITGETVHHKYLICFQFNGTGDFETHSI